MITWVYHQRDLASIHRVMFHAALRRRLWFLAFDARWQHALRVAETEAKLGLPPTPYIDIDRYS